MLKFSVTLTTHDSPTTHHFSFPIDELPSYSAFTEDLKSAFGLPSSSTPKILLNDSKRTTDTELVTSQEEWQLALESALEVGEESVELTLIDDGNGAEVSGQSQLAEESGSTEIVSPTTPTIGKDGSDGDSERTRSWGACEGEGEEEVSNTSSEEPVIVTKDDATSKKGSTGIHSIDTSPATESLPYSPTGSATTESTPDASRSGAADLASTVLEEGIDFVSTASTSTTTSALEDDDDDVTEVITPGVAEALRQSASEDTAVHPTPLPSDTESVATLHADESSPTSSIRVDQADPYPGSDVAPTASTAANTTPVIATEETPSRSPEEVISSPRAMSPPNRGPAPVVWPTVDGPHVHTDSESDSEEPTFRNRGERGRSHPRATAPPRPRPAPLPPRSARAPTAPPGGIRGPPPSPPRGPPHANLPPAIPTSTQLIAQVRNKIISDPSFFYAMKGVISESEEITHARVQHEQDRLQPPTTAARGVTPHPPPPPQSRPPPTRAQTHSGIHPPAPSPSRQERPPRMERGEQDRPSVSLPQAVTARRISVERLRQAASALRNAAGGPASQLPRPTPPRGPPIHASTVPRHPNFPIAAGIARPAAPQPSRMVAPPQPHRQAPPRGLVPPPPPPAASHPARLLNRAPTQQSREVERQRMPPAFRPRSQSAEHQRNVESRRNIEAHRRINVEAQRRRSAETQRRVDGQSASRDTRRHSSTENQPLNRGGLGTPPAAAGPADLRTRVAFDKINFEIASSRRHEAVRRRFSDEVRPSGVRGGERSLANRQEAVKLLRRANSHGASLWGNRSVAFDFDDFA